MPAWSEPAASRSHASVTPQSTHESAWSPTGVAALTFLQPLMTASAKVAGASKSSRVDTVRPLWPFVSTQTRSHMR